MERGKMLLTRYKILSVYRLVTRDSIEQGILERAVSKRKLELMTITRKGFKAHQKEQVRPVFFCKLKVRPVFFCQPFYMYT